MTNVKKRVRRDRREEILQEATTLFGIHGFRGTTLSLVAEAVGLTEPGLLHYFPNKVNLLQSVLEYRDQQDEEKIIKMFQDDNPPLFEGFKKLVAENEKKPELVRLFTVLVGESFRKEHPSHTYFVNRYTNAKKQSSEYLSNYLERRGLAPDCDIDQLAALILAVMDGLQIQWLLNPKEVSMFESFNLFSRILNKYLN
jgi:AcrR family transcriptional regulator